MAPQKDWPTGDRLIAEYRERFGDKTMLAFSRGKDAIATALAIRDKLEIIPIHYEIVPDLEFIDEGLAYYEKHLFGRRIIRMPHPNIRKHLAGTFLHQTLANAEVLTSGRLDLWTHADLANYVCEMEGLDPLTYTAIGVRSADSPMRRTAMNKYGPIRSKTRNWYPIHDWNKERLMNEIKRAGISLPVDYLLWGRSFDGLDARFMIPMRDHMPRDFQRVLTWFPLLPADFMRYDMHTRGTDGTAKKIGQAASAVGQQAGTARRSRAKAAG
jgi:hypothetical protein